MKEQNLVNKRGLEYRKRDTQIFTRGGKKEKAREDNTGSKSQGSNNEQRIRGGKQSKKKPSKTIRLVARHAGVGCIKKNSHHSKEKRLQIEGNLYQGRLRKKNSREKGLQ